MNHIEIYSRESCPNCQLAKSLLDAKGVTYNEINLDYNETLALKVMRIFNQRTVPQIVINKTAIGDYDSLEKLETQGQLDIMLSKLSNG